ncbi:MAG: hypothetical protein JXA60_13505 [Candidatus Coatesbacteria bacterium]|nr:hypothetical protein [Candidatus Coatesbacteria bacterium]
MKLMRFLCLISLILSILSCAEKEKQYVQKAEKVTYSFPPNVEESKDSLSSAKIDSMARELQMEIFKDGDKVYYKNKFGSCFTPKQLPTVYSHKDVYFKELKEVWEKRFSENP